MPEGVLGGFQTYWTTFGSGPRAALLIHCSLAHSGVWKGLAAQMGDALHMTAFDLPGHGRSGDWDDRGDVQAVSVAMARDLVKDGPVDVIGHSFGATVGLRLAVEHPELVRSLTLIEPPFTAVYRADRPELAKAGDPVMEAFYAALDRNEPEEAARIFTGQWGDGRAWGAMRPEQRAALASRIHLIRANDPSLIYDVGGLLKPGVLDKIAVPTVLLDGADSPASMREICDALAARIPRATRATVQGAAHMVAITHPTEVVDILRNHLEL